VGPKLELPDIFSVSEVRRVTSSTSILLSRTVVSHMSSWRCASDSGLPPIRVSKSREHRQLISETETYGGVCRVSLSAP